MPVTHSLVLRFDRVLSPEEWRVVGEAARQIAYVVGLEAIAEGSTTSLDAWTDLQRDVLETPITQERRSQAERRSNWKAATERHHYLSTACFHGQHEECARSQDGLQQCMWCAAPCRCACHRPQDPR